MMLITPIATCQLNIRFQEYFPPASIPWPMLKALC